MTSSSAPGVKPVTSAFQRTSVKLILVAAVSMLMLMILLMKPAAHDADWWIHAGIQHKAHHDAAPTDPVVFGDDGVVYNNKNAHAATTTAATTTTTLAPVATRSNARTFDAQAAVQSKPRQLVPGDDYFADFDLTTVKLDADPPLAPGAKPLFNYIDPAIAPGGYSMRYVSNKPRILVIDNFMSDAECDAIIAAASKSMFRSQVAPTINSRDSSVQDVRTSSQAWLSANADPAKPIVQRVIKLAGFPPGSNEELQVLRYELTQKYDAHNDYFDPAMYGPQATNRALTAFLYLSTVEEGGETWFPRADGKPPTFDYTSCSHGLRVRPKRGMAVIFYDMKPNGELDPFSLHGGCPVKRGTKWGGTLWLRMPTPPKH